MSRFHQTETDDDALADPLLLPLVTVEAELLLLLLHELLMLPAPRELLWLLLGSNMADIGRACSTFCALLLLPPLRLLLRSIDIRSVSIVWNTKGTTGSTGSKLNVSAATIAGTPSPAGLSPAAAAECPLFVFELFFPKTPRTIRNECEARRAPKDR